MKKSLYLFPVVILFFAAQSASAATMASTTKHIFESNLTGSGEVPPVMTSASAQFKATIPEGESTLTYDLTANSLKGATAAHLHCGARYENGPVIAPLYGHTASTTAPQDVTGVLSQGTLNMSDILMGSRNCTVTQINTVEHLIQAMRDGKIYVDIHTATNTNGEIRGQLVPTYDSTGNLNVTTSTSTSTPVTSTISTSTATTTITTSIATSSATTTLSIATTTMSSVERMSMIQQLQNILNQVMFLLAQLQ